MLLYDDGISGAGLVYERKLLVQALENMAGRVLLAEDFAARLFAVENIPMVGYDRCIAWYEVGTGVSTNEGRTRPDAARLACHGRTAAGAVPQRPHRAAGV